MKRILLFLIAVISALVLNLCELKYKKCDTTQLMFPDDLDAAFKSTTVEQIEWYLAASKDWEFTKSRGNITARRMPQDSSKPYVKTTVFTQGFYETGAKYEQTQIVDSTFETIDVDIYKRETPEKGLLGSDMYFSSVTIQFNEDFLVRFDEYSYDVERRMTVDAINDLFLLFGDRAALENELNNNGSVGKERASLEIVMNQYGTYDISGFVHLNKKNLCKIRVVDRITNEEYYDQLSDDQTQFYLGWSDDENDYYAFFQRLTIKKKTNGPETADVIIQLWVEDTDGNRCVLEKFENITFWVR